MVTPDEAGNWNYVFKNLPQYDANGGFITYTVEEVGLPDGYGEVIYGGNTGAGFTVENVALGGCVWKRRWRVPRR